MGTPRMNCFDTTAKILLVIFNCIFWAFGIAILGVGIWIKTDPELSNLGQAVKVGDQESVVEIVTWLFIGAGIFVFAVGVVGMIGIIRESKIMMGFYIICVFIVFLAEAGAGAYAGIRKDYIVEQIKREGEQYIKEKYNFDSLVSKGFNYVQVSYGCCGINNFMDYKDSQYVSDLGARLKENASMSWACCNPTTKLDEAFKGDGQLTVDADAREQCMFESTQVVKIYESNKLDKAEAEKEYKKMCREDFEEFNCEHGCVDKMVTWIGTNFVVMLAIGLAVGVCQLILLFLALWFCQSLGKAEK